jgi:hypothetical protein
MARKFWLLTAALLLLFPLSAVAQSTAWQIDIRGADNLWTHSLADPASDLTLIGPVSDPNALGPAAYDVIAIDADSAGTLYGVELGLAFPNVLTLGTINKTTGSFTAIAPLSGNAPTFANGVSAMTIDTSTDIGYISDGVGLWTMDLTTGACALVSATIMDGGTQLMEVYELAADGAGNFWAFDIGTDSLYVLDETTGNATFLGVYTGPGGRDGNPTFSNNGMDWDPVSGQLIGDVYTGGGTGTLGIWNTTTGAWTTILEHDDYPLADPRVGGPIACVGGTTYQFNFYLSNFLTYTTLNPLAGVTVVAAPFVVAMDFNESGDTLYAVDSGNLTLGTMNQSTGAYEPLMPLTGDFTLDATNPFAESLAYDPSTGGYYLSNRTSLYDLDVTTGNTTLLFNYNGPPLSNDPLIVAIACNSAGQVFAFSIGTLVQNGQTLWSVNLANGDLTALGTYDLSPAANFQMDMDFDPADDTLYASIYSGGGTGNFGTWNTSTGVFTPIIALPDLPQDVDGFEFILAVKPESTGPVVVVPTSLTIGPGIQNAGGLPELAASDNMDLNIFRDQGSINAVTQFTLTATSPTASPTMFEFKLEGNCISRPNVVQRIQLFNYQSNSFETVDERNANRTPSPDLVVTVTPGGDLSRFVDQSTREIRAQIRYRADIARAGFASNTDQAVWTIQ